MIQLVRANEILHLALKMGGLVAILVWLMGEAKDVIVAWEWKTQHDRVLSIVTAVTWLVVAYAVLYTQAVPW